VGALAGGWGVWARLSKPWGGEESTRPYLLAFLVPLGLIAIFIFDALLGPAHGLSTNLTIVAIIQVVACVGVGVSMRVLQTRKAQTGTHATALLYVAAGIPLLGLFAQKPEWDSSTLILRVLTAICLIGGFLLALPTLLRHILVSVFFVYHFLGIAMAATTLPVQGQSPGWINLQLSQRLYKDYLNFMYLTNAYHYYSPDPGPPQLLTFCIYYAPTPGHPLGQHQWVTVPKREDFRTRLEYQRRLGVTESTNDITGIVPIPLQSFLLNEHDRQIFDHRIPGKQALALDSEEMLRQQISPATLIRKPSAYSQAMLRTYARYVCSNYPLLDKNGDPVPDGKVTSVKVYRVTHKILTPSEFADGKDPLDPEQYFAVFQGEYDPDGNLFPNDGFLYTPLPSTWIPDTVAARNAHKIDTDWEFAEDEKREVIDDDGIARRYVLINRMRMHAEYLRRPFKSPELIEKGSK
jgi:hypothetical protein